MQTVLRLLLAERVQQVLRFLDAILRGKLQQRLHLACVHRSTIGFSKCNQHAPKLAIKLTYLFGRQFWSRSSVPPPGCRRRVGAHCRPIFGTNETQQTGSDSFCPKSWSVLREIELNPLKAISLNDYFENLMTKFMLRVVIVKMMRVKVNQIEMKVIKVVVRVVREASEYHASHHLKHDRNYSNYSWLA